MHEAHIGIFPVFCKKDLSLDLLDATVLHGIRIWDNVGALSNSAGGFRAPSDCRMRRACCLNACF